MSSETSSEAIEATCRPRGSGTVSKSNTRIVAIDRPKSVRLIGGPYDDPSRLNIQIRDVQRVRLDEIPPRLDEVAHQGRERLLGAVLVAHPHLEEGARLRV